MATYRVGIVGCTGIASQPSQTLSHPILGTVAPHSHAAGYNCVPSTEVVAVCDLVRSAPRLSLQRGNTAGRT